MTAIVESIFPSMSSALLSTRHVPPVNWRPRSSASFAMRLTHAANSTVGSKISRLLSAGRIKTRFGLGPSVSSVGPRPCRPNLLASKPLHRFLRDWVGLGWFENLASLWVDLRQVHASSRVIFTPACDPFGEQLATSEKTLKSTPTQLATSTKTFKSTPTQRATSTGTFKSTPTQLATSTGTFKSTPTQLATPVTTRDNISDAAGYLDRDFQVDSGAAGCLIDNA